MVLRERVQTGGVGTGPGAKLHPAGSAISNVTKPDISVL